MQTDAACRVGKLPCTESLCFPCQASDAAADLEKALAQEHRALGDFMITFHAVVRGSVPMPVTTDRVA